MKHTHRPSVLSSLADRGRRRRFTLAISTAFALLALATANGSMPTAAAKRRKIPRRRPARKHHPGLRGQVLHLGQERQRGRRRRGEGDRRRPGEGVRHRVQRAEGHLLQRQAAVRHRRHAGLAHRRQGREEPAGRRGRFSPGPQLPERHRLRAGRQGGLRHRHGRQHQDARPQQEAVAAGQPRGQGAAGDRQGVSHRPGLQGQGGGRSPTR